MAYCTLDKSPGKKLEEKTLALSLLALPFVPFKFHSFEQLFLVSYFGEAEIGTPPTTRLFGLGCKQGLCGGETRPKVLLVLQRLQRNIY